MIDSDIGTIATKYNVPDYKVYITSNRPINDGNYLFGGGSYSIMGMEYGNHQYGYQYAIGSYKSMHRTLAYGTWHDWKTIITNEDLMPQQIISITSIADPQNISFNTLKYTRIGNLVVGWIGGLRVLNKGTFVINNGDLPEPLTQIHVPVMTSTTDILIGNMYLDVNTTKLSIHGTNQNPTGDKGYASFCYVAR